MKTTSFVLAGALVVIGLTDGCSSSSQTPVYNSSETGRIIREERGEIVGVRQAIIKPADIGIFRGGGTGRRIGTAVGAAAATGDIDQAKAVVGGEIGGSIGAQLDTKAGEEITIRLKSDEIVVVVQERSEPPLSVGERVKVLTGDSPSGRMGVLGALMGGSSSGGVRVVREEYFADSLPAGRNGSN